MDSVWEKIISGHGITGNPLEPDVRNGIIQIAFPLRTVRFCAARTGKRKLIQVINNDNAWFLAILT